MRRRIFTFAVPSPPWRERIAWPPTRRGPRNGLKGRLGRSAEGGWFIPYYLDIGTGESQLTWQASTGLGYAWRWGDVMAGWRHLDYQMKSGGEIEGLYLDGPFVMVLFRW